MSGPPISASDRRGLLRRLADPLLRLRPSPLDPESRSALAAGWRRADIEWERVELAALEAWAAGDRVAAAALWRRGWRFARWRFAADDPRRATALANAGLADLARGRPRRGTRRLGEARRLWAAVPDWIGRAEIQPLARSSLFHLRMEARHRATFTENARRQLLAHATEGADRLDRLASGAGTETGPDRWRREKPPAYDDRRKLMAAILLLGGAASLPRGR